MRRGVPDTSPRNLAIAIVKDYLDSTKSRYHTYDAWSTEHYYLLVILTQILVYTLTDDDREYIKHYFRNEPNAERAVELVTWLPED